MSQPLEGVVLRGHAGGWLVYVDLLASTFVCQARGRLKKEKTSIITGDRVELDEVSTANGTAVIVAVRKRHNVLTRPPLANVDQVVIVQSLSPREWSLHLCDRYLVHFQLELPKCMPVLCLNKADLLPKTEIEPLQKIYEELGYTVIITSAMTSNGLKDLMKCLEGKISVISGPSGVGKSSLLNVLHPGLKLKVDEREEETGFGRHVTTCSELYSVELGRKGEATWIADTPGFSVYDLRYPEPVQVGKEFPEIKELAEDCKFSNCLHLVEHECNVLSNMDKVNEKRYESYAQVVAEAQHEKRQRKDTSTKVEAAVKKVGGKEGKGVAVPRLSQRYRETSRRKIRQDLVQIDVDDDEDIEDT
ncbi:MAG: ribosome small subunit-dependent GTPase A [Candidatus Obscuribacterales bacterium]|nr:ribosome small subunit-dependent GTPase A [Candidatus Obscuribacterales bacterium]